jgi:tRNA 5-methylaminomethyl-2-thiouridine biosynthesis bifunctional protein
VSYANIEWAEFGPRSGDRGDVYFSKAGAVDEAIYVFIEGNNLAEKFRSERNITVGELGFGFGLNFILTWKAFEESSSTGFLLYLSCESNPVCTEDLRQFYSDRPELMSYLERLLKVLPGNIRGSFRLALSPSVTLQIMIGDALESLSNLRRGRIDAWYLDGFSSHVNPEMWSLPILQQVSRFCGLGSTLASYSVAGQFRRDLAACGFEVEKVPGFGFKREALRAKFTDEGVTRSSHPLRVAIIGGGLAGTAVAQALAKRGVRSTLLHREEEVGGGASGNLFGILMPHLSLQPSPEAEFYLAGFLLGISEISLLLAEGRISGELNGVLRLCTNDRLTRLFAELERLGFPREFVDRLQQPSNGLFFGRGGYVSPPQLCRSMLADAGQLAVRSCGVEVNDIVYGEDGIGVFCSDGSTLEVDVVCLGQGYESLPFLSRHNLPIEKVRGQVVTLKHRAESHAITFPICYDGYITPAPNGVHLLGGTFDHNDDREDPDSEQTEDLLRRLGNNIPTFGFGAADVIESRVSFRGMTPDRLPIAGAVYDPTSFESKFRATGLRVLPEDASIRGLFTTTGLGSKGLISAHLVAEVVVSELLNEPAPISKRLLDAISPARFFARAIKRGDNV